MKCDFCREEKQLIYASIYTGSVCDDCYDLAKKVHNNAKDIFKIYEPYQTESGKAELRQINAFGKVIKVWVYSKRGYMFRELKKKVSKLLTVRDAEGRVI